jgi:hypothetical protein
LLKNVTEMNAAIVGNGDPAYVLKTLADAGWKVQGDYELRIINGRQGEFVSESKSTRAAVRVTAKRKTF